MLASVASAAIIHRTATTMNPREVLGARMLLKRAISTHPHIARTPDRRGSNAWTLGGGWPCAARRDLGVNERARRHRERARGGGIPHAHANGARELFCTAPRFAPNLVGSGVGK